MIPDDEVAPKIMVIFALVIDIVTTAGILFLGHAMLHFILCTLSITKSVSARVTGRYVYQ
ncbi:hypothetical protein BX666DRAFT_1976424 [Dichotomocladium elegans]|nr:hypothetical protein BX666DRAFT_1976424 [Dichotomocladium elegans]